MMPIRRYLATGSIVLLVAGATTSCAGDAETDSSEIGQTSAKITGGDTTTTNASTLLPEAAVGAIKQVEPGSEPLARDGFTHNKAVRSYFVSAGLPEDQISNVSALSQMKGTGETAQFDISKSTAVLDFYYSSITRQVYGINIADSFAWARINANGDVVSESVYWPEIPASTIADAVSFNSITKDPALMAPLLARLPANAGAGHLVIRHTPGEWDGEFKAMACYDVTVGLHVHHFDRLGNELALPNEPPL